MKNPHHKISGRLLTALCSLLLPGLAACHHDEDPLPAKPAITLIEVGHGNSCTAHPGHDLHLEWALTAAGLIRSIHIGIHPEHDAEEEIEMTYTEGVYIGVRNALFHEHIEIPATAPLGRYHLHFTVTDREGQTASVAKTILMTAYDGEEEEED